MINSRKVGLGLAALFSAVLVAPVLADGASDFQANDMKAQSTLDQISALVDGIHNRVASGGGASEAVTQQVSQADEPLKCPACGMQMSMKPSGANQQKVTIKGKTYYCCAGCNMTKFADKPAAGARRRQNPPKNP